ncbi:hypothetical protein ACFQ0B_59505 [Nonomuraea thailandensis]
MQDAGVEPGVVAGGERLLVGAVADRRAGQPLAHLPGVDPLADAELRPADRVPHLLGQAEPAGGGLGVAGGGGGAGQHVEGHGDADAVVQPVLDLQRRPGVGLGGVVAAERQLGLGAEEVGVRAHPALAVLVALGAHLLQHLHRVLDAALRRVHVALPEPGQQRGQGEAALGPVHGQQAVGQRQRQREVAPDGGGGHDHGLGGERRGGVAELVGDTGALGRPGHAGVGGALHHEGQAAHPQRPVAHHARLGVQSQGALQVVLTFPEEAARVPEEPQRGGHLQRGVVAGVGQAVVERRAQVVVLGVGAVVPGDLLGAQPGGVAAAGQLQVEVAVPATQPVLLAERAQPDGAVLADGVEHPVALAAAGGRPDQDRLVDQPGQQVGDGGGGQQVVGADLGHGRVVEAAGEHRRARPQQPLLRRAELVAPADGRAQRLVPGRVGVVHLGVGVAEQLEPVVEPLAQLGGGQLAQPGRGQLDGQRQPFQAAAQPGQVGAVAVGDGEAGQGAGGPVGQQRHRVLPAAAAGVGDGERVDDQYLLVGHAERAAAGGQDRQPGRGQEQVAGRGGALVDQVLAGVEHEQEVPVLEVFGQHVHHGPGRAVGQRQRLGDAVRHQRPVVQRRELDEPRAVTVAGPHDGGGPQRQPGLADPTHAGQRHHPEFPAQPADPGEFSAAAYQAGRFRRQIPGMPPTHGHDSHLSGSVRRIR